MRLVKNYKEFKKWFSIKAMLFTASFQILWVGMPEDMKASLHPKFISLLTIGLMVIGILGRLIDQSEKT